MGIQWNELRDYLGRFFSKSKVRTEEALQIAQLNQKLRSLRNEKEDTIKKLGEETFRRWKYDNVEVNELEELLEQIKEKEEEVERVEEEKEHVRQLFSEKIREMEIESAKIKDENKENDLDKTQ